MIRKYFKLDKEQSDEFIKKFRNDVEPLIEKRNQLIDKFKNEFNINTDLVGERGYFNTVKIIGYKINTGDEIPKWAKRDTFLNELENKQQYLIPNKDSEKGEEFQNWLNEINEVKIPSLSDFAVDAFIGKQPNIIHNGAMHYAIGGFKNETVLFSIPTTKDKEPLFNSNYKLIEIKELEYNTIIGE